MKVYLPEHLGGAGLPIYTGYFNAWKKLGFDPEWYIHSLPKDRPKEYYAMTREDTLIIMRNLGVTPPKGYKSNIFSNPEKECRDFLSLIHI